MSLYSSIFASYRDRNGVATFRQAEVSTASLFSFLLAKHNTG
nr:MAG TPA: hypothetical protein [Caudoviricetes sp.]